MPSFRSDNPPDKMRSKRAAAWVFWGFVLVLAVMQVFFAGIYYSDEAFLSDLMNHTADAKLPASEQALRTLDLMKRLPSESNESYFLIPPFHFLRATPRQIAERGGDCSDRSRLIVNLLHTREIHAAKWALYSPQMHPVHAVVEVETERGKMVVDPLFGVWFPRPDGGFYGIEDLRKNPQILRDRVQYFQQRGIRPGRDNIAAYPLDLFVYDQARTFNWEKSSALHWIYQALHRLIGERANHVLRPRWLEVPSLFLFSTVTMLQLCVLAIGIVVAWRARRNPRSTQGRQDAGALHLPSGSLLKQRLR